MKFFISEDGRELIAFDEEGQQILARYKSVAVIEPEDPVVVGAKRGEGKKRLKEIIDRASERNGVRPASGRKPMSCSKCGEQGHTKPTCPN